MSKFSDRMGITRPRTTMQVESVDNPLRNGLWNALDTFYLGYGYAEYDYKRSRLRHLIENLWLSFFKLTSDTMPSTWTEMRNDLREYYFKADWYKIYNFIEFFACNDPNQALGEAFTKTCNQVLETELSAYRFVGKEITPITSKDEISEIEEALETPLITVRTHLENALKLFSDRKSPDYRNSIKESISSVEAVCRVITGSEIVTLGKALDIIEKEGKINLHGALKDAFDHLYGYTSSADGIRHAFSDEKINVDFDEAKFMLVACSAFVNYLISKASKVGLLLG